MTPSPRTVYAGQGGGDVGTLSKTVAQPHSRPSVEVGRTRGWTRPGRTVSDTTTVPRSEGSGVLSRSPDPPDLFLPPRGCDIRFISLRGPPTTTKRTRERDPTTSRSDALPSAVIQSFPFFVLFLPLRDPPSSTPSRSRVLTSGVSGPDGEMAEPDTSSPGDGRPQHVLPRGDGRPRPVLPGGGWQSPTRPPPGR